MAQITIRLGEHLAEELKELGMSASEFETPRASVGVNGAV
jgi:hypothetical protein